MYRTLERMGHQPISCAVPVTQQADARVLQMAKDSLPPIEILRGCDAILLSGPEHIIPWLDAIYTKAEWTSLQVPKLGMYHESFWREDYQIEFDAVSAWSDEHFFPAYQDADFFDQESFVKGRSHWLPLGVDTKMFRRLHFGDGDITIGRHGEHQKLWDVAFVGSMYEKREKYLNALARHHMPRIRIGNVSIVDLGGYQHEESTRRLAEAYRSIGVFFNLMSLSKLIVSKVYEVMACGTFLLTPELPPDKGADKNMAPFKSGEHLVYYRSSNLPYVAQLLREYSSPEKLAERERIAAAGCAEVHKNHSLEKRLTRALAVVSIKEVVQ